jgi:hypothetical protein
MKDSDSSPNFHFLPPLGNKIALGSGPFDSSKGCPFVKHLRNCYFPDIYYSDIVIV